jgi:hypothetical protein
METKIKESMRKYDEERKRIDYQKDKDIFGILDMESAFRNGWVSGEQFSRDRMPDLTVEMLREEIGIHGRYSVGNKGFQDLVLLDIVNVLNKKLHLK